MLLIDQWAEYWGIAGQPCIQDLKERLNPPVSYSFDEDAATESNAQGQVRVRASELGHSLMRNNNGAMFDPETNRVVRFGLGNDSKRLNDVRASSDLIGWTMVQVTPEMVGSFLAVFTAIEMKVPGWKGPRPGNKREQAQSNFITYVRGSYGIAGFATCTQDYERIIT